MAPRCKIGSDATPRRLGRGDADAAATVHLLRRGRAATLRGRAGVAARRRGWCWASRPRCAPFPCARTMFLSSDLFRYIWDGRVQLAGINPYLYVPAEPALAHLRDTAIIYRLVNRATYAHTIYPPMARAGVLPRWPGSARRRSSMRAGDGDAFEAIGASRHCLACCCRTGQPAGAAADLCLEPACRVGVRRQRPRRRAGGGLPRASRCWGCTRRRHRAATGVPPWLGRRAREVPARRGRSTGPLAALATGGLPLAGVRDRRSLLYALLRRRRLGASPRLRSAATRARKASRDGSGVWALAGLAASRARCPHWAGPAYALAAAPRPVLPPHRMAACSPRGELRADTGGGGRHSADASIGTRRRSVRTIPWYYPLGVPCRPSSGAAKRSPIWLGSAAALLLYVSTRSMNGSSGPALSVLPALALGLLDTLRPSRLRPLGGAGPRKRRTWPPRQH